MNYLNVYKAEDVLRLSEDEVFNLPDEIFWLDFEDQPIITTRERTAWSWILWDVHREYPDIPLISLHHIRNELITPNTHVKLLTRIKNDCVEVYGPENVGTLVGLNSCIHRTYNKLYNICITRLEEYVTGASALDILEVLEHPVVSAANQAIFANENITAKEISEEHDKISKVLDKDHSLTRNSVAIAYRNSLVKRPQLMQCVSARGFIPGVNNEIYSVPMKHSYSTGMRSLTNYICDSRMASISAIMQDTAMRSLQYTNRSFQILNSEIRNISYQDCGTMEGSTVVIDSKKKLKLFEGMYHMVNNKWVEISGSDTDLVNQPIYLRTMVSCKHPDRHTVCLKCLGQLGTSVITGDYVGPYISARVQEKESQGGLSVKHYSANAFTYQHVLDEEAQEYFHVPDGDNSDMYIKSSLVNNNGSIIFLADEVSDVSNAEPLVRKGENFLTNRYSKIRTVVVNKQLDDDFIETKTVDVGGLDTVYLTMQAIHYLFDRGVSIDDKGNWVLDVSGWDTEVPFFKIPRKKIDMVQAAKRFETFLRGIKRTTRGEKTGFYATDYETFSEALMALVDLTDGGSNTPVTHLQVMLYGLLAANPFEYDFRLPDGKNRGAAMFVTFKDKVTYGNMAMAMAYERQGGILLQPSSYNITKRSRSDYEWFVVEGEKLTGG